MREAHQAVVIGAGIGGLAAAVRLAAAGKKVKLFEANPFVGGKINSKVLDGFRFDMGPSIFTCPHYIKELYDLAGKDFSEFEYRRVDELFRYFYPDGSSFVLKGSRAEMIETIAHFFAESPEKIDRYFRKSAKNYRLISPLFIERSLHRIRHLMTPELFRALANLHSYALGNTMHGENSSFFKHPGLIQFFDRFATYNGSSPYKSPAMLNMISHLEIEGGIFIPKDGIVQISRAVYELALGLGVEFHLEEKVNKILYKDNAVTGVQTSQGEYPADLVFSNMDIAYTYEKLLPKVPAPRKILNCERSSSAVVFYWGMKRSFPEFGLHNILFSQNYQKEFDDIFERKMVPEDPTIYVNITSKYVSGDAPEGCENWFVMINSPILNGQDWDGERDLLRQRLTEKINAVLKTDISRDIVTEFVMDPQYIDRMYSGKFGSIYGNSSNGKFAAFYRHPNFSKKMKGLYFVGVTVHPGGGIPLALNSAKIAVRCMQEDGW